jgi:hypothetical protein
MNNSAPLPILFGWQGGDYSSHSHFGDGSRSLLHVNVHRHSLRAGVVALNALSNQNRASQRTSDLSLAI